MTLLFGIHSFASFRSRSNNQVERAVRVRIVAIFRPPKTWNLWSGSTIRGGFFRDALLANNNTVYQPTVYFRVKEIKAPLDVFDTRVKIGC